ncbi:hypothetical protein Thena_1231 [Thermodesulfobium narugense DSM 14796]|uniref:Uncharacterized protein n=1 Tax=Thermodesulfobium narugense DSM 14796 TaxID=747365 RepID=M1E8C1_9BACT|nr:hypothetical protein [Thermodesulfobium narugense]AEE14850.1 hypothetical protein Thena_1231 [Thermodesulfobium narugense DSM 14796]
MINRYLSFIAFIILSAFILTGISYSKGGVPTVGNNNPGKFEIFEKNSNHGQEIKDINMEKNQEKKEIQNEYKNEIQEKNEIKNSGGSEEETINEQNQIEQLKQEKKDINKEYTNELKANGKENKQ